MKLYFALLLLICIFFYIMGSINSPVPTDSAPIVPRLVTSNSTPSDFPYPPYSRGAYIRLYGAEAFPDPGAIVFSSGNKTVMKLNADGTIEFGVPPSEATREFGESLKELLPEVYKRD
jgi:hypothetical protein